MTDKHLCRRCGRNLLDPARIRAGIGYCCAKNEEDEGMKNDFVIARWSGWKQAAEDVSALVPSDEWKAIKFVWTKDGCIGIEPPNFSTNANLWFGQDGLLKRAKQAFGSQWIIASMRMDWEQGPHLWAKTLAGIIEEASNATHQS